MITVRFCGNETDSNRLSGAPKELCHPLWFPVLYAYGDTDKLILLRHVVCALAGVAAQDAFTQGYSAADVECGGSADRPDAERLAMLIAKNDVAEIMVRAEAMAAQLVTLHCEHIFTQAGWLYAHGLLSGAEVRELDAQTHTQS